MALFRKYGERRLSRRKAESEFSTMHPLVLFVYYVSVIILSMVLLHPTFLLCSVILLILLNVMHGIDRSLKKLIAGSLILAFIIAAANPLLSHRGATILFYLRNNPITLEAITYGYTLGLSFLTIAFAFASYHHIVTSHKFLYLFQRISPKAAILMMITIRFVPLFFQRLKQITMVQKTKGVDVAGGSLRTRAKNGMKLVTLLLVFSLEEALQTADSMQARGFGAAKRTTFERYRFTMRDGLLMCMIGLALLTCLIGSFYGYGVLSIYPTVASLGINGVEIFILIIYLLLISLPILIEGRERVWWRMQKS